MGYPNTNTEYSGDIHAYTGIIIPNMGFTGAIPNSIYDIQGISMDK